MICIEDIKKDDECILDCCKHNFCFGCIQTWVTESESKCPACKKSVKTLLHKNLLGEDEHVKVEEKV